MCSTLRTWLLKASPFSQCNGVFDQSKATLRGTMSTGVEEPLIGRTRSPCMTLTPCEPNLPLAMDSWRKVHARHPARQCGQEAVDEAQDVSLDAHQHQRATAIDCLHDLARDRVGLEVTTLVQ